jgi:hypothetical protein
VRLALALLGLLACASTAQAQQRRHYLIAIGNNAVPVTGAAAGLTPLRYADDDAASLYQFSTAFADRAYLLAVLDADSQARYPAAASASRPPTLWELRAIVHELRDQLTADRRVGIETTLTFFFSGHGVAAGETAAALAMLDGALTRQVLYEEILTLPASYIHVLVDACHAETIVRPRDASAAAVDVSAGELARWVGNETLARFPNVGAVIASSAAQQTHEWDRYQGGVFTHEILSGLRGAADVNGDRRIEYSELHAFLTAANREVRDPRARPNVIVRVPPINLRVALVDLNQARGLGWARYAHATPFSVESAAGERLVDSYLETGYEVAVALPASARLFFRTREGEAPLSVKERQEVRLDKLRLAASMVQPRGALESALDEGLFAVPFGPAYYRGFVDQKGMTSVTFPTPERDASHRRSRVPSLALFGTAGGTATLAAIFGGLALSARSDWESTTLQRAAVEARDRYDTYRAVSFAALGVTAAALTVGLAIYPWRGGSARR